MDSNWLRTIPGKTISAIQLVILPGDIDDKALLDTIDQMLGLGAAQVVFTGGEPTLVRDLPALIARAKALYGYDNFICDTSGSICEIVDPTDKQDPVLSALADNVLMIWIEGSEAHTAELVRRFDRAPKPMCYNADFLSEAWSQYTQETGQPEDQVDPDAFVRWTYARALAHRQPRYRAMAEKWGITVSADDIARVQSEADMIDLISSTLP